MYRWMGTEPSARKIDTFRWVTGSTTGGSKLVPPRLVPSPTSTVRRPECGSQMSNLADKYGSSCMYVTSGVVKAVVEAGVNGSALRVKLSTGVSVALVHGPPHGLGRPSSIDCQTTF